MKHIGFFCRMIAATAAIICSCSTFVHADPGRVLKLRVNTSHGLANARGAVVDAGLKLQDEVIVTPSSPEDGRPFLPPEKFIVDALNDGASLMSSSFSGWDSRFDSALYPKMVAYSLAHVYAYVPKKPQPKNVPPPAVFVTVNMVGGQSGHGIEFGMPTTYMDGKGKSSYPSGVTAQLAGLLASLKFRHPDWNWFDVKAALRATAANYLSGYDPARYGYGLIDYFAANALTDAAALPLFAPAAVVARIRSSSIDFAVNSFRQSRRSVDAVFTFKTPPATGGKELTLGEITAMGGTQAFSGETSLRTNRYRYTAAKEETLFFVWFTRDARGFYSRIEPYSIIGPVTLKPGSGQPGAANSILREDSDLSRFAP
ncbi:hypothetical protein KI809_04130 [Geobacter pelophilus]|uniref:Subtilase family protein n=1 Tax=Geoanaerobacter pelophilus TaxID=60036 RepID=A0AAW4KXX9_9BACT|nr:hypothetical protein [Geoanaerobacter pelophilus]MBT0663483.1 hypothetical protein [Geoanaerobacter pelophilus]